MPMESKNYLLSKAFKHLEDLLSCEPSKDLSIIIISAISEYSMSSTTETSIQLTLFQVLL